jgi:hypothetical protein
MNDQTCRKTSGWVKQVVRFGDDPVLAEVLHPKAVDLEEAKASTVRVVRVERIGLPS